jgi:putative FmdB family regulatory protein
MPLYEYYCAKCASTFELLRPMLRSNEAATCPAGHGGGRRTLSLFAAVTKGEGGVSMMDDAPSVGGGCACGGGGCGCGH